MKPTDRYKLRWFLLIVAIWVGVVLLTPFYEYFFLANYPGVLEEKSMRAYDLTANVVTAVVWGLVGASFFAFLEVFYLGSRLQRRPFYQVILLKGAIYFLLLLALNVAASYLFNFLTTGRAWDDPAILKDVQEFVSGPAFWHPLFPFLGLVLITLFLIQINQRFGQGELFKLVRGRYFSPREENRIFMFLDIKDSTTLAEQLGHLVFFDLLNDFFHDITDTILEHEGEIYSYVGDEVIITWRMEKGVRQNNCVRCFFAIRQQIEKLSERYLAKYGLVPDFKAGIHFGEVTMGEIGKIKKLVTYTGDVMNTTARIQSICNEYGEKLIISRDLLELLQSDSLQVKLLGQVELRGKSKPVGIVAVRA